MRKNTGMDFNNKTLCVFLGIALLAGCKKDENNIPALGYSYYPLTEGKTNYYQVDSIGWLGYTYDPINQTIEIDTATYQVKEVVEGFFTDAEGRETARVVRYRRNTAADPWVLLKVIADNLTRSAGERYEDNVRYFKVVFPATVNKKWTGQNINPFLNDTLFDPWEYEYTAVDEPLTIGSFSFDSTLTVLQKSDVNLVLFKNYIEKYAAGTGLIYKEYKDLEFAPPAYTFISNGFIYKETLINP